MEGEHVILRCCWWDQDHETHKSKLCKFATTQTIQDVLDSLARKFNIPEPLRHKYGIYLPLLGTWCISSDPLSDYKMSNKDRIDYRIAMESDSPQSCSPPSVSPRDRIGEQTSLDGSTPPNLASTPPSDKRSVSHQVLFGGATHTVLVASETTVHGLIQHVLQESQDPRQAELFSLIGVQSSDGVDDERIAIDTEYVLGAPIDHIDSLLIEVALVDVKVVLRHRSDTSQKSIDMRVPGRTTVKSLVRQLEQTWVADPFSDAQDDEMSDNNHFLLYVTPTTSHERTPPYISLDGERTVGSYNQDANPLTIYFAPAELDTDTSKSPPSPATPRNDEIVLMIDAPTLGMKRTLLFDTDSVVADVRIEFENRSNVTLGDNVCVYHLTTGGSMKRLDDAMRLRDLGLPNRAQIRLSRTGDKGGTPSPEASNLKVPGLAKIRSLSQRRNSFSNAKKMPGLRQLSPRRRKEKKEKKKHKDKGKEKEKQKEKEEMQGSSTAFGDVDTRDEFTSKSLCIYPEFGRAPGRNDCAESCGVTVPSIAGRLLDLLLSDDLAGLRETNIFVDSRVTIDVLLPPEEQKEQELTSSFRHSAAATLLHWFDQIPAGSKPLDFLEEGALVRCLNSPLRSLLLALSLPHRPRRLFVWSLEVMYLVCRVPENDVSIESIAGTFAPRLLDDAADTNVLTAVLTGALSYIYNRLGNTPLGRPYQGSIFAMINALGEVHNVQAVSDDDTEDTIETPVDHAPLVREESSKLAKAGKPNVLPRSWSTLFGEMFPEIDSDGSSDTDDSTGEGDVGDDDNNSGDESRTNTSDHLDDDDVSQEADMFDLADSNDGCRDGDNGDHDYAIDDVVESESDVKDVDERRKDPPAEASEHSPLSVEEEALEVVAHTVAEEDLAEKEEEKEEEEEEEEPTVGGVEEQHRILTTRAVSPNRATGFFKTRLNSRSIQMDLPPCPPPPFPLDPLDPCLPPPPPLPQDSPPLLEDGSLPPPPSPRP
eukprot:TRINITY_DN4675_c0_g1_i5.p1 TRINITY_DN4675_c0_g1~~TRINITY_DN4675_c0_g1_i5.p1  ORF type:complete len:1060 (+),score=212.02 TRINITY_DN4675_c0_g1_i5:219-3182(+)